MEIILNSKTSFHANSKAFVITSLTESNASTFSLPYNTTKERIETTLINTSFRDDFVQHVCYHKTNEEENTNTERLRRLGHKLYNSLNTETENKIELDLSVLNETESIALLEGFLLSNYTFNQYKSTKPTSLLALHVCNEKIKNDTITELKNIIDAVFLCRDLVNEPANKLDTYEFANRIEKLEEIPNVKVQILNQKEIESLKMGGLLAVNQGSEKGARFAILEHKPAQYHNEAPFVLVGKGVVYDTGGHSLKPTPNSMDIMKCDMGGAATVVSAFKAIATNKIPCHLICLVPITDNMLSAKAFAPGDVITMFDNTTVEVKNTDAEGRLILADALSFAKKYKPALVIDVATLTGAALRAIGHEGIIYMGKNNIKSKTLLESTGEKTYERLVELPLWDEYRDLLKSDIADISNLGPAEAGAITAGKFLEHFIDYNWLHLDIAGPAFLPQNIHYRSKNGSGTGVRLLYNFLKESCR